MLKRGVGMGGVQFGTRRGRALIIATVVLAVLALIVEVGWNNGHPANKVRLLSGAVWLPSSHTGQLTLLHGPSAEVAAQIQVAPPGHRLSVVQHDTTAYVINHTEGSLRRVDGATFKLTPPIRPIPDAGEGLQVYPSAATLFVLDTHHGLLTHTNPTTLTTHGGPQRLADQPDRQAATLDDTGRLWILDTTTGDLTWINDGESHTRRQDLQPGPGTLVLADNAPVLINIPGRTATTLNPETVNTENTTQLDVHPDDTIQLAGSLHAPRLHLVTSRGDLTTCDLTSTACEDAIPLGDAGQDLGPPLDTGNHIFIPDHTHGRVWIVDLQEKRVMAQPTVLKPLARFELLNHDGIVFFNDPYSERAGIIRHDGTVIHVPKHDAQPPSTENKPKSTASAFPNQTSTGDQPPTRPTNPSAATSSGTQHSNLPQANPTSPPQPNGDPAAPGDPAAGGDSHTPSPDTGEWGMPIYQDHFNGGSLSTADWYIYDDTDNPDAKPPRRPDAVKVHDGVLQLIGGVNAEGKDVSGGIQSKMGRKYGRWEIRFKVDRGSGYSAAVLLWPERNEDWPDAGEIDFTEIPGGDRTTAHTIVHNGPDNEQVGATMHADFTQWHTVGVEWTADYVAFYLDGAKQQFTVTDPTMVPNLTPMRLALQLDQGCDDWIECRNSQTPPQVGMNVDWVKVYAAP